MRNSRIILIAAALATAQGAPAADWEKQARLDAAQDRRVVIFDGRPPDSLACDTTLRKAPDGSWVMVMLGGGDREPLPANNVFLSRSSDEGRTWSPLEPVDLGVKAKDPARAIVPSELMIHKGRATLFVATHDGKFGDWTSWYATSDDSCRSWSALRPLPGRLHRSTFVRNHIVNRAGRIVLPFQHYESAPGPVNPRNGVMISNDAGNSFAIHGWIRISEDEAYRGWAENNIVELSDGSLVMLIRAGRLGGVLYRADSRDSGRTWSHARPTDIPNPGSKITLYGLGGNRVALLHNPNPKARNPLALWISFDGAKTWPYRRELVRLPEPGPEAPKGASLNGLNYPDGFVSEDGSYLHFAFDERRCRAVYYGAKLPPGKRGKSIP